MTCEHPGLPYLLQSRGCREVLSVAEKKSRPGTIHQRIVNVLKRFQDGVTGGQIREELEKEVCGLEIRRTSNIVVCGLKIRLRSLSTRVGCPSQILQKKLDFLLCKALAVGVKLRQQLRQGLGEGRERSFKFGECAAKGTNSLQVFIQAQLSFCIVLPYTFPILAGEASRCTTGAIVG